MSRMRLITAAAAGCLALTACSGAGGAENGSRDYASDGTFVMSLGLSDPGTFDPYRSQAIVAVSTLAYDSLLNWQKDGTFASGLASEWTADADGAVFTLKEGITCSDGTAMTASQVAENLKFLADPANGSSQYGVTVPTVPFTVTADDDARTVQVTMSSPYGFILNTIGLAPMVCAEGMKDPKVLQTGSSGTGPFELTDHRAGESMTFTRRDDYTWGPDGASTAAAGTPSKVVLKFVTDETTAANLLLSDQLNLAGIGGPERERLEAQQVTRTDGSVSGQWIWFNQISDRPTKDATVREALMTSIDLPQLIKVSTGGHGEAARGLIGQETTVCPFDAVADTLPDLDADAAAAALDGAGWEEGTDGVRQRDGKTLSLDIHYVPSTNIYAEATAELLAKQWNDLGVKTRLTLDSTTAQLKAMFEDSDWDIYLAPFGGNLPTQMVPYLSGPLPPNGMNLAGIQNADYDKLAAQAQTLTAPEACPLWKQAEQALYKSLDVVPVSRLARSIFLNHAEAESNGFQFIPTTFKVLK
ncbi:MAG: ABC transporter substrate-binding protein [Pseudonocardiaceae bacterium]